MRAAALGALLLCLGVLWSSHETQASTQVAVRVTHYYATGSPTYSGVYPYQGSAACSWNFPLGSIFRFRDGREVICLDRGRLGWTGWLDVFAANWWEGQRIQQSYEYWSCCEMVEILRWGFSE